jgi:hypothetical protein
MRAYYGATQKNMLKGLTGDEGIPKKIGDFDNESSVLTNPDGTPKKGITGTEYDLTKVAERIKTKEPFQLYSSKYQKGRERDPWLTSDVDALTKKGGDYATLGNSMKEATHTAREKTGKWLDPILEPELSASSQKKVVAHLLREEETGRVTPYMGTADEAKAYAATRNSIRELGVERRAANMMIAGRRAGLDPSYFPRQMHVDIMHKLQGPHDAEWNRLKTEFFDYNTRRGLTPDKIERAWKSRIGSLEDDVNILPYFKALREAEGIKLPDSWVSHDLEQSMARYFSNAAKDLEWFKQVETPHRNLIEGVNSIAGNPRVRSAFEGYVHDMTPVKSSMRNLRSASRVAGALLLTNPLNRVLDAATTPFKLAPFVNILELPGFLASARNFRKGMQTSFRQGTIRRNGDLLRQLMDVDTTNLDKAAKGITKITGTEMIERNARGLAQSMGEYVAKRNVIRARAGDRSAIKFLENVSKDWDTIANSPEGIEKLGARVGQIAQGAYDATNLPAWMRSSEASLLFPFMKWNIEQTNNFKKFIFDGGPKTILASLLSAALGGVLFKEIREKITGNKPYDATFEEIKRGTDRQKTAFASTIIGLMQQTGYMGALPILPKMGLDMFQGRQNEPFRNLALNAGVSVTKHISAALDAWNNGEPLEKIVLPFAANIAKENSGMGRLATQLAEPADEKKLRNTRREYHVYQFLRGEPILPITPHVSYRGTGEKAYDKAPLDKAGETLRPLVGEILGGPKNILQKSRELQKLRTPGGAPTAPSINSRLAWIQWTKNIRETNPTDAQQIISEEIMRQKTKEIKRKMVPQLRVH